MVYVDAAASVSKGKQAKRILRVCPAEFEQMCEQDLACLARFHMQPSSTYN